VVTPDERTLLFASNRGGGAGDFDIWSATRASATSAFDPAWRSSSVDIAPSSAATSSHQSSVGSMRSSTWPHGRRASSTS